MMIHYNQRKHQTADNADRDSAGLDAGAVVNAIDPDLFFDRLPQPFRSICKLIESIVSNACDQVDSAVLARARSMRLSKQELADLSVLEQVDEETQLSAATTPLFPIGGSLFVFFSSDFLILWESCEMLELDSLAMCHTLTSSIKALEVSPTRFLVILLTLKQQRSVMTIVGVLNSKLHIITQQEVNVQGSVAIDCALSPKADLLLVAHSGTDEIRSVEVYQLQSDTWFRALDAAVLSAISAAQTGMPPQTTAESPIPNGENPNADSPAAKANSLQPAGNNANQATVTGPTTPNTANDTNLMSPRSTTPSVQPAHPTAPEQEKTRFPACQLSMRFKYPIMAQSSTLAQFVKSADAGEGLGLGSNHLLSQNFLSLRQTLHKARQASLMPLRFPEIPESQLLDCSSHRPPIITWVADTKFVVAWPDINGLVVYSALKPLPPPTKGSLPPPAADNTDGRPESSWPTSSSAVALSTSPCRRILAVLLESGNVLLLNSEQFSTVSNVFTWIVSATYTLSPIPSSVRKFSVVGTDRIVLETSSVIPTTAYNFSALLRYDESAANISSLWKFNSLDIGSDFACVELFDQWPTVVFIGLPDGALLLCERDVYAKKLTHLRLPSGYVWPTRQASENTPILRLTADGRTLFALARYESLIVAADMSTEDAKNKLFRFDLVSNLPAHLVSRWNPMAATAGKLLSSSPRMNIADMETSTVAGGVDGKAPAALINESSTTAIANLMIKQSVCSTVETTERLKYLWAEERDRNKDSRI